MEENVETAHTVEAAKATNSIIFNNDTSNAEYDHQIETFPKPRLTYFNAQGRAELIRLILSYLKVNYEDVRFRHPPFAMDDFEQFKKKNELPFAQVPLMEIDGMQLAQSAAIVRYISRKYGLIGDNEKESAYADMVYCGTEDLRQKFTSAMLSNSGNDMDQQLSRFKNEVCPTWGAFFENLLQKNGGVWFVGNKITYADFAVYDTICTIVWRLPSVFDNFKSLQAHKERIEALPSVAAWLKARPVVPV